MRRIESRMTIALMAAVALIGTTSSRAEAGAIYSVATLGTSDPSGNYLNALSPTDQAAFQSGSFDQYAHPVVGNPITTSYQGDVGITSPGGGETFWGGSYVTSNNNGVDVGVGAYLPTTDFTPALGTIAIFTPDPHVARVTNDDGATWTSVQSPGYVNAIGTVAGTGGFKLAGISDNNLIVYNSLWQTNSEALLYGYGSGVGVQPWTKLGTLGGLSSAAEALNNAGDIVGSSTTSSGAQHAFLYSHGIMEDLNNMIPATSGLTLTDAVGIDASGQIVAYGTNSSGATVELLLTPNAVPEPTAFAVFGLATVVFGARHLMDARRKLS